VEDKTPPTWTTAATALDITIECSDSAAIASAQAQFPMAKDNCDKDVSKILKTEGQFVASEGCANSGTYTNTWTVTDACGNTSTIFTQVITIKDTKAPEITTCPSKQIVTADSKCQALVPDFTKSIEVTDNCSSPKSLIITQTPEVGSIASSGITKITITIVDSCGNSTSCETQLIITNYIVANDDSGNSVNGYIGGISFNNVLTNDLLDCMSVKSEEVQTTFVSSTNPGISLNGTNVVVAPGTPAGNYILIYQICEIAKPENCDTASVTVTVTAPEIIAQDDTIAGGNGANGNTNAGNVLNNNGNGYDTLNGANVTIEQVNLTISAPATPIGGAPVPVITTTTGQVSVPAGTPAGIYSIVYTICEKLNPTNCDTATVTVTVTAPEIDATNDTAGPIVGINQTTTNVVNVFTNDTLNGEILNPSLVTLTPKNDNSYLFINPDGSVDVLPNAPEGPQSISYQICEKLNPENCDTAIVTVMIEKPIMEVSAKEICINDIPYLTYSVKPINFTSDNVLTIEWSDSNNNTISTMTNMPLNGQVLWPGAVVDQNGNGMDWPGWVFTNNQWIETADGFEGLRPKATLTFTLNPTHKIEVNYPPADPYCTSRPKFVIDAVNDLTGPINGLNGGTNVLNVYTNDTLNGTTLIPTDVTLSLVTPDPTGSIQLNPDGSIDVKPGTAAGIYNLTYSICENAKFGNCDQAIVTVTVSAPIIDAVNDAAGPVDGINGVKNILNVFTNDTLNGFSVNPTDVSLTMVTPDPKGNLSLNPDGSVDIKAGTPAGIYSFTYSICEKLNPQNCDEATVTITVICNGTKISGIIYNAGNNNAPLANVPITLTPIAIVNGQNSIAGTGIIQITNAQGQYNYTGMPEGDYVLQVQDANLNVAYDLYNVTSSFLVLKVEKCNYLERNFGYDKNVSPVLGDFVWYDVNNNGLQDEWYDANNDGLVTKNIPDANGNIDSSTWEWIDYNGDNSYKGLSNYGELNAAGFGNGTTNVPNLFITGPNGYSVTNTMGIQGFWRVRPPQGQYGLYSVEMKMESHLNDNSNAMASSGLVKVLPGGPAFKLAKNIQTSKTNSQTSTICGGTNSNPQTVNVTPQELIHKNIDFGIVCKEFGAIDDIYAGNNSFSSGLLGNVLTNDLLNGIYVDVSAVNFSVVSGSNPNINIDNSGNVYITSGTAAGTYVFTYNLCDKLNVSNCVTATVTVIVTAPVIVAQDDLIAGGNGAIGNTNAGNVLNNNGNGNDTLNGSNVTIDQVNLTIVTPANSINGAPVPVISTTSGQISIPAGTPAGNYTIVYAICEKANPSNCDSATVNIQVLPSVIIAKDDDILVENSNVATFAGLITDDHGHGVDTLNGIKVILDQISITVTDIILPSGQSYPIPKVETDTRNIFVPQYVPAGVYIINYTICEKLNPDNCSSAVITITVKAPIILAQDDIIAGGNGTTGNNNAGNVLNNNGNGNDTLNGANVTMDLVNLTVTTPANSINGAPVPVITTSTGLVSVPAGTPAGNYTIMYSICDKVNPTNCDSATVTVTVTAPSIVAQDDTIIGGNGANGNTNAGNVLNNNGNGNDTYNGVNVNIDQVNLTITTAALPIGGAPVPVISTTTGQVSVPVGTPAGNYTIIYSICDKLNPTNCDTAIVTVSVTAPIILAQDDVINGGNGDEGNTNAGNVLSNNGNGNDTLNGVNVSINQVNLSISLPAIPIGGAPVPEIDTNTGQISIPIGTPAGNYTIVYSICEKTNPINCDAATVTITVEAGVVFGCEAIVVHNAVTANNDGINDYLHIDGAEDTNCYPSGISVEIYNRWGVLVFETSKYNNTTNYFDGFSRGRTTINKQDGLPTGTYFYIINYESVGGNGNLQGNRKEGFLYLSR
jgi:gliding motility-associated-like protein